MDQRCPKYCRPSKSCCDTRNDLKFNIRIIHSNLIHKTGHTINTGIAAADHRNNLTLFCLLKCQHTAVYFFFHRCGKKLLIRECILYKIYINGISDDRVTVFQGFHSDTGHLVTASRSDSYNIYFIQNVPPISGVQELSSHPLFRSFF